MEKPLGYHGEWSASGGPTAKNLGACGHLGFGLRTSLGTPFTMIPPLLFPKKCTNIADNSARHIAELQGS